MTNKEIIEKFFFEFGEECFTGDVHSIDCPICGHDHYRYQAKAEVEAEKLAKLLDYKDRRLLSVCKRLLEQSLQDQEEEWGRDRKYMLSKDCKFTLYREADLLIKELEEND